MSTIHLVSSDLSHQETILQIVDALDHLDKITEAVFSSIQSKITENASKLSNLDQRVDIADQKVKKLAEMSQKATCIYSSAKYPEEIEKHQYISAFKDLKTDYSPNQDVILTQIPEINLKGLDMRDIQEKKRYFHLPVKRKPSAAQVLEENPDLRLPSKDTKSALSYLIFNTAENPYSQSKDYQDPLDFSNTKSKAEKGHETDANEPSALGEAPVSFGLDSEIDTTANLFFAPALGDLPDLDLPDILDLPNLPTDLSYMTDLGPGIAPSVHNLPELQIGDLPEPGEDFLAIPPPPPPESLPPPPPASSVPIPPPPPPLELVQNPPKFESEPAVAISAPILTETPPESKIEEIVEKKEDRPDGAPKKVEESGGSRASLMAAIRLAGGSSKAGLKSVKEQKMQEKKAKQEEMETGNKASGSASSSGDLMADLASKLVMRRKGISGAQNQQSSGTLETMSMMIPSLAENDDSDSEKDSDNDDWN